MLESKTGINDKQNSSYEQFKKLTSEAKELLHCFVENNDEEYNKLLTEAAPNTEIVRSEVHEILHSYVEIKNDLAEINIAKKFDVTDELYDYNKTARVSAKMTQDLENFIKDGLRLAEGDKQSFIKATEDIFKEISNYQDKEILEKILTLDVEYER